MGGFRDAVENGAVPCPLCHLGVPERPSWGCPRLGSGAQVAECGGEGSSRPCVSLQILKSPPCPLWAGGEASRGLSLSRPAQGWLRWVLEGIKWAAHLQGSESQGAFGVKAGQIRGVVLRVYHPYLCLKK